MTELQMTAISAAFVILFAIAAAAQWNWLPPGYAKTVLVFIAGVSIIASLRIAGIPPKWFAGTTADFALAGSLIVSAILPGSPAERSFRFPLLLGMGLTLLVLNFVVHV